MNRVLRVSFVIAIVSLALIYALGWMPAHGATALPDPKVDESPAASKGRETVVLAGGCFWGIQDVFEHVKGVTKATAGYSGGTVPNPSYELVSSGTTGHAESVQVVFDPSRITFGQLLKIFLSVAHDPTELDRQGPDFGTQYRSAIFYETPDQQRIAQAYVEQLTAAKIFSSPIVTQIVPFKAFYRAEDYHQDYAIHNPDNPYIAINDLPKVGNLKKVFPELYVNYP
ncbi:MAG TPA: peptide-methionine (S)-S-oxide reductase MsrA [Candidatus Aquilonibacter sp.]|nr:peptide-methionine (S)-S-oxide reductase MsrA [Candidatus Aquilonibacter sp.]